MTIRLQALGPRLRGILVGVGVSALAILISQFAIIPAFALDPSILDGFEGTSRGARTALLVFNFIGLALGGAVYLWITGRGWSFVDLAIPGFRDVLWIVAGFVALVAFFILVGIVSVLVDAPAADSDILLILEDDVTMVLIMLVIVFLFNAPAEEFLFRNVVQKRLYAVFSGMGAVLVTSVIFMIVHIPMFITLAATPLSTGFSLVVMFGGSVIFGYVYLRTGNLIVPIAVHALGNALQLVQLLATMVYDIEPAMVVITLLASLA